MDLMLGSLLRSAKATAAAAATADTSTPSAGQQVQQQGSKLSRAADSDNHNSTKSSLEAGRRDVYALPNRQSVITAGERDCFRNSGG